MLGAVVKRNRIHLEDYDYERDIRNRLLMADFSSFDVELLEAILDNSVCFPLDDLADELELTVDQILPSMNKFVFAGLLKIEADRVIVDKEMRKYFEFQILKFDNDFHPDMEFLQSLLRKVPIHVLPVWYSVPRTSDNIFKSLVDKFLLTPRIYQRYLAELSFDDETLNLLMQDFLASDGLLFADDLREKYALSKELFAAYMLQLEFSFVATLSYQEEGEAWREVITPFHEWAEYCRFLSSATPATVAEEAEVCPKRGGGFAFASDLSSFLDLAKKEDLFLNAEGSNLSEESKRKFVSIMEQTAPSLADEQLDDYLAHILSKALALRFAYEENNLLVVEEGVDEWLDMDIEERAAFIYRHPRNPFFAYQVEARKEMDRDLRSIERSLDRLVDFAWVFLEDFIEGFVSQLGNVEGVVLMKRGRRWRYNIPQYSQEDLTLIEATIVEKFFEGGIVNVGTLHGRTCISLTDYGCQKLSDV